MIPKILYPIALTIILTQVARAQVVRLSPEVKAAMEQVSPDELKADIAYLADDKLLGRMPGTPGFQMAVDYVSAKLKALGVKPAGDKGYLQTVKLRRATAPGASLTIGYDALNPAAVRNGNDVNVYPNPVNPNIKVNAPMVFVGYGISQPALGYDDYAGIDVKGKVVVVTRGAPDSFQSAVAAHVSSTVNIMKNAAEHGAIGVMMASADSTLKILTNISRGVYCVLDKKDKLILSRVYYSEQIKFLASAKYTMFGFLCHNVGKDVEAVVAQLKKGQSQSFALNSMANVSINSVYQTFESYNIIGKIEGSDPKLRDQYVVHSAHLDHLGIGQAVAGDSIYNGAQDNAAGVASLLGIAKMYSKIKDKPKRSILMVFVTGEEMGDLGSGYFAMYPTVPVKSMVADVNVDQPTLIAPLLSITALGAEHSSLATQVSQAAGYLNIIVEPDPEPKEARFTRSDQYSFVLAGIPALNIKYGSVTADGKNNMNALVAPWRDKYYHKPQDDINGPFDFDAAKKHAQLNFLIGYLVAQDKAKPGWNAGDFFEPAKK
jgi:hypothetical protein